MLACVIHGRQDLRIEERAERALRDGEVRLALAYGGVCGSDLHYRAHGRVGASVLTAPMVLGHEIAGRVIETAPDVAGFGEGDLVAVNPALPCRRCRWCATGRDNLCAEMRFLGSAARRPHQDGAFVERPVVRAEQCARLPAAADPRLAALVEPYAVALHAARRAGALAGARVLVTGCGPIGALVVKALKRAGAAHVRAVDIAEPALAFARAMGADEAALVSTDPGTPEPGPPFDAAVEASGAPSALDRALRSVERGGRVVLLGTPPPRSDLDLTGLLAGERELVGAYRFADEFVEAAEDIGAGRADLAPLVTAERPLAEAAAAFDLAADRARACKVLLRGPAAHG